MNSTQTGQAPIYSSLIDDPDLGDLIELFVDEMPERLATFDAVFQSGNRAELRRLAHQLKGSAGSYGFESATRLAGELEAAIDRGGCDDPMIESYSQLVEHCLRIRWQARQ